MALPALVGLLVFLVVPFVVSIVLSLYNVRLNSPVPAEFFGLENYRRLLTVPVFSQPFLHSILNNFTFAALVVPLQTGAALGLALLLNRKLRGMTVFRTFFFMPVVYPMALVAIIWRLILDPGPNGLVNALLGHLTGGLLGPHDWLGSGSTAMLSVIVLSMWQGVGFQMVIILAGLQRVPRELYEAASVDGAGRWQRFRHVTLPGIRNTLVFVATITTIEAFRVFDQIYILITTAGLDEKSTQTMMYLATITAFDQQNVGRASAISMIFFCIVLAVTLLQRMVVRQRKDADA
ncbi:carbohydrate ABC transporter permease [Streptomyces sp. NPDC093591]|uniref:carbohydrate ABC transporter permease n=1 Tax=Streptomyces sp. NPDC093591 TaxID=3366044 RepID=UPI0038045DFE